VEVFIIKTENDHYLCKNNNPMKRKVKSGEVGEPVAPYQKPASFESVWQLLQETDRILSEKFQETDLKFQETDLKFKETDKKFQETDKTMKELQNLFTSHWGKLMEYLVKGDLVRLLQERNIPVQRTTQRVSGNYQGTSYEFDIIAINGEEVVIVEVKTTLRPSDIIHFMGKLAKARTWLHEYRDKTIYGAIAFLQADSDCDKMALKKGLFVIRATGSSASIINPPGFKPKVF
jgi:hypothetical protein